MPGKIGTKVKTLHDLDSLKWGRVRTEKGEGVFLEALNATKKKRRSLTHTFSDRRTHSQQYLHTFTFTHIHIHINRHLDTRSHTHKRTRSHTAQGRKKFVEK